MASTSTEEVLGQGQVAFDVPARADSLQLLRLGAADRAASLGLGTDTIDRARVVVDELAGILVTAAPNTRLRLVITGRDGGAGLHFDGRVPHPSPAPEVDLVVVELLDLCAGRDAWDLHAAGGWLSFQAMVGER